MVVIAWKNGEFYCLQRASPSACRPGDRGSATGAFCCNRRCLVGDAHAPGNQAQGLFASEAFTTRINELEPGESTALLQMLCKRITRPEFSVRWQWRRDDLAFWDNRLTQHYACDDYRPQRRIMHRATILGNWPFGP